jgi:hypothetical protein
MSDELRLFVRYVIFELTGLIFFMIGFGVGAYSFIVHTPKDFYLVVGILWAAGAGSMAISARFLTVLRRAWELESNEPEWYNTCLLCGLALCSFWLFLTQ